MLQFEVLILESRAINGFSTSAVMVGEVSSLTHAARSNEWRGACWESGKNELIGTFHNKRD